MEWEEAIDPYTYRNLPYKQAKVIFTVFFKTKRKRDVHNYVGGGLIAWLDCLSELDLIEDDCYDCVGQPIVIFDYDKEFPRTEIQILEVHV